MTPFLKLVAHDVYKKFNGHLEDVAIVFPNKRAGLFFNSYLLECNNNAPLWSPAIRQDRAVESLHLVNIQLPEGKQMETERSIILL